MGEGLGSSLMYKRLGKEIGPWTAKDKDDKDIVPDDKLGYVLFNLHGIDLFYDNELLMYTNGSRYY